VRLFAFQLLMQLGSHLQELPVPRLPDLEKRPRVQPARDRPATVQALFKGLVDEILFKTLTARILENCGEPKEFLPVEAVDGVLRVGHGALEIYQVTGRIAATYSIPLKQRVFPTSLCLPPAPRRSRLTSMGGAASARSEAGTGSPNSVRR